MPAADDPLPNGPRDERESRERRHQCPVACEHARNGWVFQVAESVEDDIVVDPPGREILLAIVDYHISSEKLYFVRKKLSRSRRRQPTPMVATFSIRRGSIDATPRT